ncbi:uncharacterized protein K441DRAFT_666893 [Cenococcum geophilum 1.58]|uniref:uncharacterized protein n=1 Tax=Cenococcum geophilum 1.58 TaxID=794803 RepID=UPI00358F88B8|nr:hypothetical protein K441DRAFT_666893 [Cenococcum geophilum 1.58]
MRLDGISMLSPEAQLFLLLTLTSDVVQRSDETVHRGNERSGSPTPLKYPTRNALRSGRICVPSYLARVNPAHALRNHFYPRICLVMLKP